MCIARNFDSSNYFRKATHLDRLNTTHGDSHKDHRSKEGEASPRFKKTAKVTRSVSWILDTGRKMLTAEQVCLGSGASGVFQYLELRQLGTLAIFIRVTGQYMNGSLSALPMFGSRMIKSLENCLYIEARSMVIGMNCQRQSGLEAAQRFCH